MFDNHFYRTLFKTVLFFAFFHLILLAILSVLKQNFTYINVFNIIGISEFFPGVDKGIVSFILSILVVLIVYLLFYKKKN